MRKYLIIPVLGLALLSFVIYGTNKAYADNQSGKYPPIIKKLVERFNLNEEEVKKVFDEAREERRAEMRARFEERLNQAVKEGKITEQQKKAIMAKKEEMQAEREKLKDLTPEERRQMREKHKQELEAWAKENGIDLNLLPMLFGKGHHGPHHGDFGGSMFHK